MAVRIHQQCLFAPAPVADCGREIVLPPTVLASSWPLALLFIVIVGLAAYAYLRSIYPADIEWESGDDRPQSPEDETRRTPL